MANKSTQTSGHASSTTRHIFAGRRERESGQEAVLSPPTSVLTHLARVVRRHDLGVGEGAAVHLPPVVERDGVEAAKGHEELARVFGGQIPHLPPHVPELSACAVPLDLNSKKCPFSP